MSLTAYCIGNPLFSGHALVTQCEQMTNWLRINILLILERRIQGIWHLRISFIFRVHTQAAGYSSKENLFKTSPSILNRVHVKGESATPHQTTETFPVGPLNTPSRARRYNRGKEEKKKMCCHMFRFPVSWLLTLGPKQHCCVGNSTLCKKLDGCC